ncbi:hypothetical protein [Thermococcus sp.]|uniref:hypothetical protein n=1 Tax=Thermococcus sp. TaxID=35749 RepID=UPI0019ADB643|nr:hypothetical protein [Thermococcus sp.]MBC7094480.1 hypothetical protein [Thermococcus sp.]
MRSSDLDPGIYLNMFEVKLPEDPTVSIMISNFDRIQEQYGTLKELKHKLEENGWQVYLYRDDKLVYGYGAGMDILKQYGFRNVSINLLETPKLTSRMILEGFVNELKTSGFSQLGKEHKGRVELFDMSHPVTISNGEIFIYKGLDIRSIFLKDHETDDINFWIIVDITYLVRDKVGTPLNPQEIVRTYGREAYIQIKKIQGELLSNGRINTMAPKERFKQIMSIIQNYSSAFDLPCGIQASLIKRPVSIVIGGEEFEI